MNNISIIMLGASAIWLAACSQPPAPIAVKGSNFYGREGVKQFAQNQSPARPAFVPEYHAPVQAEAAPISSMQVEDLPEPSPIASRDLPAPEPVAVAEMPATLPQQKSTPFQTATYTPSRAQDKGYVDVESPRYQQASVSTSAIQSAAIQPAVTQEQPQLEPLALESLEAAAPVQPQQAMIQQAVVKQPASLSSMDSRASNFIWPTQGKVVSRFGPKANGLVNDGINIAASEGEPIWAAAKGEVVYSGNELKGYGNMVIIRHTNGWMTAYAHASDMLVSKGDSVSQGDLIGYVGSTGAVSSPQLHFGIREGKSPVDPETLLPTRMASAQ